MNIPQAVSEYIFKEEISFSKFIPVNDSVLIIDHNVYLHHENKFTAYKKILLPSGEAQKSLATIEKLADELLTLNAHRQTTLFGIGGGVTTDITGFLGAVYMRGIEVVFIPTTLLAMIDAAVGGKNWVNLHYYKNLIGTIKHADKIFFDPHFLSTLPDLEWRNGIAEIIKYGCIAQPSFIDFLEQNHIEDLRKSPSTVNKLIAACVEVKNAIVAQDEHETGVRKFLNFGHTLGHAIERMCSLQHGAAIAIGMKFALKLSEEICALSPAYTQRLDRLLRQFDLPTHISFDPDSVMEIMIKDKKRKNETIEFILLEKPGNPLIKPLSFQYLQSALQYFRHESHS